LARQSPQGGPPASALTVLGEEVDRISDWFKIPAEQARGCLERLVAVFAGHLLDDAPALDRALHRFPLSLLEDALIELPKDVAVRLIAEEDLRQFADRVRTVEWLIDDDTPFCTLDELATHVEAFRDYQKEHRNFLVQTGLPPRTFRDSRWLYIRLARLYDTRTTASPWPPDEFTTRNRHLARSEPYTWIKPSAHEGVCLGIMPCQYHEADYLEGLEQGDADRLEGERDKLFEAKVRVLDLLISAARQRDVGALWPAFLKMLADHFTPEDVAFFFRMDEFYLGTDARYGSDQEVNPKMVPGGLTNWIEVLGHLEKEVRIGTLARTKAAMPPAIYERIVTPVETSRECRWGYFHVLSSADQGALDAILRRLSGWREKERKFWAEFRERVAGSLSGEFRVPVSVFVPIDSPASTASFLQQQADRWLEGSASPSLGTPTSRRADRGLARFPSPEGLRWSEVTMEFVAETEILIKARDRSKTYSYTELGFKDGRGRGRGHGQPDKKWRFLLVLARKKGEVAEADIPEEHTGNTVKNVQELQDRLQEVMGIAEQAIRCHRSPKRYKAEFNIHATTLLRNLANSSKSDDD
jgi:hypothetical protein